MRVTLAKPLPEAQNALENELESSLANAFSMFCLARLAHKNGLTLETQLHEKHFARKLRKFRKACRGAGVQVPGAPVVVARIIALVASRIPKSRRTSECIMDTAPTGKLQHHLDDNDVADFWSTIYETLST
jgi:hypothetical protein